MSIENREETLRTELGMLRAEHRRLDEEIAELEAGGLADRLEVRRLKKRKLAVKDRMSRVEDELYPDIIA